MVPPGSGGGPRIVIADDDPPMRALLEAFITVAGAGPIVGVAADGREALDAVIAHSPDVALLDVQMPRMRGPEVAALIGVYRPETRVILHTAQVDESVRTEAAALGVPLLDKMRAFESLGGLIAAVTRSRPRGQSRQIEEAVMLALEREPEESVIVINQDGRVRYYDHRAAEMLELPFPFRPISMAEFTHAMHIVDATGNPRPTEERPLLRTLTTRKPTSAVFYQRVGDEILTIRGRAKPLWGQGRRFLGAAAYWTIIARDKVPAAAETVNALP